MTMSQIFSHQNEFSLQAQFLPKDALLFFIHIPKTAGTSLMAELSALRQPSERLTFEYFSEVPIRLQQRSVLERFFAAHRKHKFGFASGHVQFQALHPFVDFDDTHLITFLRDPVDRVWSDYHYQRSERHPLSKTFRSQFSSLEAFLRHGGASNKMYKFLRIDAEETVQELIGRLETTFLLVGTVEHYQLAFRTLTALMGEEQMPHNYLNQSTVGRREMSDLEREMIASVNQHDLDLHAHFSARWEESEDVINRRLVVT